MIDDGGDISVVDIGRQLRRIIGVHDHTCLIVSHIINNPWLLKSPALGDKYRLGIGGTQ